MNVKARCGTPSSSSSPVGARVRVLSAVYRGGGYNVCTPSRGKEKKMIPLCYCKMKGNISFINLLFLLRSSSNFLSPPTYSFSTHEATFHHFIMSHSGEGQQPISSQYGASVADLLLTLYSLIHSTCGSLSHL